MKLLLDRDLSNSSIETLLVGSPRLSCQRYHNSKQTNDFDSLCCHEKKYKHAMCIFFIKEKKENEEDRFATTKNSFVGTLCFPVCVCVCVFVQ